VKDGKEYRIREGAIFKSKYLSVLSDGSGNKPVRGETGSPMTG
jgi:hypothetical protein